MSPREPTPGLLVVDKQQGRTSHQVVGRVRHLLGTRKVGHAGTLDPMATGVLVVGVGRATRLLGHLSLHDKEYLATIRLGVSTVSDDADGDVVGQVDASGLSREKILAAMAAWTGDIQQVPSSISAIKVDGQRAYARVRAGDAVELAARPVTVSRFDLLAERRLGPVIDLDVAVECTSGTYVRALARDVGRALGVGGHLTALRRTRVGPFTVSEAVDVTPDAVPSLLSLPDAARRCFPCIDLDASAADDVSHGRRLGFAVPSSPTALLFEGELLGLYRPDGDTSRAVAVMVG